MEALREFDAHDCEDKDSHRLTDIGEKGLVIISYKGLAGIVRWMDNHISTINYNEDKVRILE